MGSKSRGECGDLVLTKDRGRALRNACATNASVARRSHIRLAQSRPLPVRASRHQSCISPGLARGRKPHLQLSERVPRTPVYRAARASAAAGSSTLALVALLALAWTGCGEDNEACSWLRAPPSFVDAGHSGCTAEPAGQTCDRITAECVNICQPTEYLLTCRSTVVGKGSGVETFLDPVVVSRDGIKCNAVQLAGENSPHEAKFCCRCAP